MNKLLPYAFVTLMLLPLGVSASTIVDNGDGTKTYTETFETEPVGSPPEESWYDTSTAGTGGSFYTETDTSLGGTRNLRVGVGTTPFMGGLEFAEAIPTDPRDLCDNGAVSVTTAIEVPTWGDNAQVWFYRLGDTVSTTTNPFNSFELRLVRSGTVSFVYTLTGYIRGAADTAVSFGYGTIDPVTDITVKISEANCTAGPSDFSLLVEITGEPDHTFVATDSIAPGVELDTISTGTVSATGLDAITRLDNIVWANIPKFDTDGDGVYDDEDNCPDDTNANQADADMDGIGDVCEADSDGDGVVDDTDNCPSLANPTQTDANFDGIGDACQGIVGGNILYSEDFQDDTLDQPYDETWYSLEYPLYDTQTPPSSYFVPRTCAVSVGSPCTTPTHTSQWGTIASDPAAGPIDEEGAVMVTEGFSLCDAESISFWVKNDMGAGSVEYIGLFGPDDVSGSNFRDMMGVSFNTVSGNARIVIRVSGLPNLEGPTVAAPASVWYNVIMSEIDCEGAAIRVEIPALSYDESLDHTTADLSDIVGFGGGGGGTASQSNAMHIDDFQAQVPPQTIIADKEFPFLRGFDVDNSGNEVLIVRRSPNGAEDLETTLSTHDPQTLDDKGTDHDECNRPDGVSAITHIEANRQYDNADTMVSFVVCEPSGEINEMQIRDAALEEPSRCSYCVSDLDENSDNDVDFSEDIGQTGILSQFPFNYAAKVTEDCDIASNFFDECAEIVTTAWTFTEVGTGKLGVVVYNHVNERSGDGDQTNDQTDNDLISFAGVGDTASDMCSWRATSGEDLMAAAHPDPGVRMYGWTIDRTTDDEDSSVDFEPDVEVTAKSLNFINDNGAIGVACAGSMVAHVTSDDGAPGGFRITCAVDGATYCGEGDLIHYSEGYATTSRGVDINHRPCPGSNDHLTCYYGAFINGTELKTFRFVGSADPDDATALAETQNSFEFTCSLELPQPKADLLELELIPMEETHVWLAYAGAEGHVYVMKVTECTTVLPDNYAPVNLIAGCGLCDSDGDGIQDGDDPQPGDPDCDNDTIPDGEDPEVHCDDANTGDPVTCINGVCQQDPPEDGGGGFSTSGGGFTAIFHLNVPEPLCSILGVVMVLIGAMLGWRMSGDPTIILIGAAVGLVLGLMLFCMPIWVIVFLVMVAAALLVPRIVGTRG